MAMLRGLMLLGLLACAGAAATAETTRSAVAVNPIRKVVTMLQMMQKKIIAEGEKEKELFERFMCYCKTGTATLEKSIADAEAKIADLGPEIKEAIAQQKQFEADVTKAKEDRAAAKQAMAEATAIREKEAAEFKEKTAETKAFIAAIEKAIAALEKGMAGAFLQTSAATVLRRLALSTELNDAERDTMAEFLGQDSEYAPQSGEIVGILKQMLDTMHKDLADLIAAEEEAKKLYEELMAAKTKEVETLTKQIEEKLTRLGEMGVEIVNMKEDLDDTEKALEEDKKFLEDLKKNCATKEEDWAIRCKTRSEEILALAETIKILNDDDALELFKKTLPAPSLLQVEVSSKELRARALSVLQGRENNDPRLDFIALAIRGKKVTFEKVIQMIDEMVELLGKEQVGDDEKKAYCEAELDTEEDNLKVLELAIGDLEKAIQDAKTELATTIDEIEALIQGIKDLDKAVAEATEQRKEEHEEFLQELAANTAAKTLIGLAKNRMNKFYNPKLYKPPPKREVSAEDRIALNLGGTMAPTMPPAGIAGTNVVVLNQVAPPPPPETYGAYQKKGEESSGVIAMMDLLIKDLAKQITEGETEEKLAQEDYEKFMADSAEKRALDTKTLADKEAAKADLETNLQAFGEELKSKQMEAMATMETIKNLHLECDWLVKNYDIRKEARAGEVDALKKAKAVLSGADYSLVQTAAHATPIRLLRGAQGQ